LAPLSLLVPLGLSWLLAVQVDVLVVQQYAYVGMLIVSIWSILGHRLSRYLAFPMLFLLFAVPVGEGLTYPMMNFTADFTVGLLKWTGVPVYREGIFFTLPSGRWSVVEACSGVRYLIASVTLGVLFAYLSYSRLWKRIVFVVAATLLPIVANGLRAYMIVMIGHWSDMKLAVGVDHLIYGWVFFGVLITILFFVGNLWRDPPRPLPTPGQQTTHNWKVVTLGAVSVIAIGVSALWPALASVNNDSSAAEDAVVLSAPLETAPWVRSSSAWDWRPRVTGADGSVYAFYRDGESVIGLYLGVYRSQSQGAELVSSSNVMVPQKHPVWSDTSFRPYDAAIPDYGKLRVERHKLASRSGQRLVVWTWYRVSGLHTANPYFAKIVEAVASIFGGGGTGALIAVAAEYDEKSEHADRVIKRFVTTMLPAVDASVDRALAEE
jgi:exosortase A